MNAPSGRFLVRIAAAFAAVAALVATAGCTMTPGVTPPPLTVLDGVKPLAFGPFETTSRIVIIDGAEGPEFFRMHYRYSGYLASGTLTVLTDGAVDLKDGTVLLEVERTSRRATAEEIEDALDAMADAGDTSWPATKKAALHDSAPERSSPGDPLADLLAYRQPVIGGNYGTPPGGATSKPAVSLFWYPTLVSKPTQSGTTGTRIIVQQIPGDTPTSRVFLRPPLQRPFRPVSKVWVTDAARQAGVSWLTTTSSYIESVQNADGLVSALLPISAEQEAWLQAIEESAEALRGE